MDFVMRSDVEEALEEARLLVAADSYELGNAKARFAAQLARSGGYSDLEYGALLVSVVSLGLAGEWEEMFLESSQLLVALGRSHSASASFNMTIACHVMHVHAAFRVLRHFSHVEQLIAGARSWCEDAGHPENAIEFDHALSRALIARGHRHRGLSVTLHTLALRRSMTDAPGCPLTCYIAAAVEALSAVGKFDEAYQLAAEGILEFPGEAEAWLTRANLLAATGRFEEAKSDFDTTITLSDQWETRVRRAIALAAMGDANGAAADVAEAVRLAPESSAAQLWKAIVTGERDGLDRVSREHSWNGSLAAFLAERGSPSALRREALRRSYARPYLAEAWMYIGVEAERAGDVDRAAKAYRRARLLAVPGSLVQQRAVAGCAWADAQNYCPR